MIRMGEVEWKGIFWKAAFGNSSVKDLLTILKGYGPMEVIQFEKPGCFRGYLSLCLNPDGTKEITLHHFEVLGERRRGRGRAALLHLKKIFKGNLYIEYPGGHLITGRVDESLLFWVRMFKEGIVAVVDSEPYYLEEGMDGAEVDRIAEEIRRCCQGMEPTT